MEFKKTFMIVDTGYQRNIYYYVNGKRVSNDTYFNQEIQCQRKGMRYNSSLSYTAKNGRTVQQHSYN